MRSISQRNFPVTDNLQRIISEKGLKQVAVAEMAHMSKQELTAVLKGRRLLNPCEVRPLCRALGVDAAALFRMEGDVIHDPDS